MKHSMIAASLLALSACSAGSSIIQANENAVTIRSYGGNYSDFGLAKAIEHCGQYGKVAVAESSTGLYVAGAHTYLCK